MVTKRSKLDFETALAELETLVSRMEQGNVSLEESLQLYERGVKLSRICQDALRHAEQKVQILQEKQGQDHISDFPSEE
jgi:farnesyl diphosphate synthase